MSGKYIAFTIDPEDYKRWLAEQKLKGGNFPYYNPARNAILPSNADTRVAPGTDAPPFTSPFPIMASSIKYGDPDVVYDQEYLKEVKSCWFTVCGIGTISSGNIKKTLENAPLAGIAITCNTYNFQICHDENGNIPATGFGIKYLANGNENNLGGIGISDEPTYEELLAPPQTPADLKNDYWNLLDQNPQCVVYINLVGSPTDYHMDKNNPLMKDKTEENLKKVFTQYVQAFQDNFLPSVFSYDLYPFKEHSKLIYQGVADNNSKDHQVGTIEFERENFYRALEIFASFSKTVQRPFWVFCQSMSFMVFSQNLYRPHAKEQYLRYESFVPLAYGAQGIRYWTYAMRNSNSFETYFSALLNRNGEKTASWYYAQKINKEIQTYRHVFLNSTVDRVTTLSPEETFEFTLGTCTFRVISEKKTIISHLKNEHGDFIVVVNENPFEYQNINVLVGRGLYVELTPEKSGGETNKVLPQLTGCSRILIPGGYRIFRISSEGIAPGQ